MLSPYKLDCFVEIQTDVLIRNCPDFLGFGQSLTHCFDKKLSELQKCPDYLHNLSGILDPWIPLFRKIEAVYIFVQILSELYVLMKPCKAVQLVI